MNSDINISPDLLPDLNNDARLLVMIEKDEGNREELYQDSAGLWTIGIGFCLERRPMPREVALFWLDLIIDEIVQDLARTHVYATWSALDRPRQMAVVNMCYQLGVYGVCHPVKGFKNMWRSLSDGDYEEAASHAIDSNWYRQTPNRAMRVAAVIRTGRLEQYGM